MSRRPGPAPTDVVAADAREGSAAVRAVPVSAAVPLRGSVAATGSAVASNPGRVGPVDPAAPGTARTPPISTKYHAA